MIDEGETKRDKVGDSELLRLNAQGLIPGPGETVEEFAERAAYCLKLKEEWRAFPEMPYAIGDDVEQQTILRQAHAIVEPLYGIKPTWMPLIFSNEQLAPWHGGCATIFQVSEDSPTSGFLQLRAPLRHKEKYLALYRRDELLAHEMAHLGRMAFNEPRYEEIIAFRTSHSSWRRFFAPIVQSAKESASFLLLLLLMIMADLYFVVTGDFAMVALLSWLKLLPILIAGGALLRLWHRQRTFEKCLTKLTAVAGDHCSATAIAYRLEDAEIALFSKSTPEQIVEFAAQQRHRSLRWRSIALAYLPSLQQVEID